MFIVNVEGAIFKDDKWLLIERSVKEEHAGGLLSFVGGKVENTGDSPNILESTLKREILEEVGIHIKEIVHYAGSSSFTVDTGINVINIVFLCEYLAGEPYAKSPDEVESIHWMTKDEVMDHVKTPIWLKENMELVASVKSKIESKTK
ncbi:NUDIX domain-containing protein [Bacillus sp. FJAT-49736]|uniref:NUDIX hydrolase n=1 Tax=Bacillus sp. FJAT-49736 TaxID=2833582 RepID=UPI001BCA1BD7|nr:NUDIX domain-containing protein [Bacillus sp. FJAT-49736]